MPEDLLTRARTEKSPLIDGKMVTFIWEGDHAPALIADFNAWEEGGGTELQPSGPNLWKISFELPLDAYVQYAFLDGKERRIDPLNPRTVSTGMGDNINYFYMPNAHPAPELRPRTRTPRGKVFDEVIAGDPLVIGGKRRVYFYQPLVDGPCPAILVWDGQDYLRRARLTTIVDNLIHAGRIRPVGLIMPEHGRKARMVEYGCSDITLGFVESYVMPRAREYLNLIDPRETPGAFGVMGASMGGLMALYAGLRMPGTYGKVLSQSGAFSVPFYDFVIWDLVGCANPGQLDIWMDCGTMEWLTDTNRKMAGLLKERGFRYQYHEYNGGHNYTSWRNDLIRGLEYLFGPK